MTLGGATLGCSTTLGVSTLGVGGGIGATFGGAEAVEGVDTEGVSRQVS